MIIIIIHVFFLLKETDIRVETDDACAVRCCDDPAPPEPVTRLSWPGQRVSVVQLGASVTCISFQHTESVDIRETFPQSQHRGPEQGSEVRTEHKGEKRSLFTLSCLSQA